MKRRVLPVSLAGIVALAGAVAGAGQEPRPAATAAEAPTASPAVLVYYFHATTRCATCRKIEAYAHETVTSRFAPELEARRLEWKTVNVDEPANQHYVRDFQLYTRSVVLVDRTNPRRFKVLDRVWQLVGDKAAFQTYVEQELRGFGRS